MATSPTAVRANTPDDATAATELVRRMIQELSPNSPLLPYAGYIAQRAQERNINPAFIVALGQAETQLGTTGKGRESQGRNVFGIGNERFATYRAAVDRVVDLISGPMYYGDGRYTIASIIAKYSPPGAANDPHGTNAGHPANIASIMRKYGWQGGVNQDVRLNKSRSIIGAGGSGVSEAASAAAGVPGVGAVLEVLKFLTNPELWLRIGTMILGVIAMAIALLIMFRGAGGSAAKPVGILILMLGIAWIWAGLKNINPIKLVRDVVRGGATVGP